MTPKQDFQILVNKMPLLAFAVSQLLEQQEKHWGCFQIKKGEDRVYRLYIPALPVLKLKVSSNNTYRAFWGDNNRSSVYTKQEQKTRTLSISELEPKPKKKDRTETNNKQPIILSRSTKASAKSSQKPELVTMKQNIYEIVYYRSSAIPEINLVNQIIAGFLREKIEKVTSESELASDEMMPLVLMTAKN